MNSKLTSLSYDTFNTPVGEFTVAVNPAGEIVATAFGGLAVLQTRLGKHRAIYDSSRSAEVRRQVLEYFAGTRQEFSLPLAPSGTEFQQRVWRSLRKIPHGTTRSYGELAVSLGNAKASRAVGRANATNPICLFIPCHRVIGSDGSLTGFAFGEAIKERLLKHEGALAA